MLIRFRWLVIILALASTVLATLPLQSLRFEGDIEANFPANDPVINYNKMVEERFGIRDLIMVGVFNDNPDENGVFNPRTLGIVKEFSEKIALLPGIKAVRDEDVASVATMATSGKAIFFNAVVVIGGFLVLLTSSFRPNFYLGAMLSLNMGACLLVSMTVLPAILNRFQPRFVYGEKVVVKS